MWVTLPDAEPSITRNLPDQNAAFKRWGGGGGGYTLYIYAPVYTGI